MPNKLSDYALIGNARSAALVSNKGSIDWCCLPEFDSPAIFAALLDEEQGGHFSINPNTDHYISTQAYIADTNVVETIFETESGKVRLMDAFAVNSEEEKKHALFADHEILRVAESVSGTVQMKMEFVPRLFYGRELPHLKDRQKLGIHFSWKGNAFTLLSTLEGAQLKLSSGKDKVNAEFSLQPGERVIFSFSYAGQSPAIIPEVKVTGWSRMQNTVTYWKNWMCNFRYSGVYEKEVRRSVLVLKLLTHAPSGAIIAAPTASLPEEVGGVRNWDYRYCWLRDASFTIRVLVKLGFEEEAHAFMNWILHATQLTRPKVQVVYSVYGRASIKEKTLGWLKGYKNSRPVRIGNEAGGQFQLDVYGEVLDAFYTYAPLVEDFDRDTRKFLIGLGETICKIWEQPDNGIWEIRTSLIHHTHSKVMAWVGLNRLIQLSEKFQWNEVPLEKFSLIASCIRDKIERQGYNSNLKSYTRELNGKELDASLLTLSLVGYCNPASPGTLSTTQLIHEQLSKNNLIYRYLNVDDGIAGTEGTFGICYFWLAENLAKSGVLEKAKEAFETMLRHVGSTGLFSEEIDPETHELLGNYPQGFTHIGLINAALAITEASQKKVSTV
ncbi:glycoside hydrolase family 15 protein [Ilyomonas limi]|uniref:Glycoside hydrolase family 15 protein n=1 Tax=Ilyomonas limi TaxID=2575867 RepID=A0A4U3KU47_9BACT|nr:glycoside hydrolase family 15 protein [Ilyomonas limi]TKK65968.1 glycoside hydrolase family 15 protein [Ilyomonas limi]